MKSIKPLVESIRTGNLSYDSNFINNAAEQGIVVFYIKGENIHDKTGFFNAVNKVMQLPDYFGNNWDAFEECINDLSWIPSKRYIFIYDNTSVFFLKHKEEGEILLDILNNARENWRDEGISFESVLSFNRALFKSNN